MRIPRLLKDYRDAGAVNTLLALWGFVDDETFITKSGHVGVVYALRGADAEGLTHGQRRMLTHRFEAALRLLDERCRVYQYVIKQVAPPFAATACPQPVANEAIQRRVSYLNGRLEALSQVELFMVLLLEAPIATSGRARRQGLRAWLSAAERLSIVEGEIDRAVAELHHKAGAFEVQLADLGIRRLPKSDAFRFLRQLLNYEPTVVDAARLSHDTHLD